RQRGSLRLRDEAHGVLSAPLTSFLAPRCPMRRRTPFRTGRLPLSFFTEERNAEIRERRSTKKPRFYRPRLEALEDRTLLAVSLAGVPVWVEQGPGPITNSSGVTAAPNNREAGAVESLAVHPNVAANHTVFAGTVAGGVWRTTTIDNANPAWEPLTDQLP